MMILFDIAAGKIKSFCIYVHIHLYTYVSINYEFQGWGLNQILFRHI